MLYKLVENKYWGNFIIIGLDYRFISVNNEVVMVVINIFIYILFFVI